MPMILLDTKRSDKFSIDESNIEDALIEKPLEMKLFLSKDIRGYDISLLLEGDKYHMGICHFMKEDKHIAKGLYDEIVECIKIGNYKLSKTKIKFNCYVLEAELEKYRELYDIKMCKSYRGEPLKAIIVGESDK